MCPPDWRSFAPVSDATPSSRFARQACWLLLAPLLAVSAAYGQEPSDEALKPLSKAYVKNILLDQKAIWTSPFHMTRKDAQWWLTFGAIVSVAVATDRRTSRQLPNTADQVAFSSHVSQLGAAYTLIPIAGGFYVTGVLAKKAKLRGTGSLAARRSPMHWSCPKFSKSPRAGNGPWRGMEVGTSSTEATGSRPATPSRALPSRR